MIEARVECVCAEYQLPELGLVLYAGQVVWLAEDVARKSGQLHQAQVARAVQVRWASRCAVSKPVPPPNLPPAPPWLRRRGRVPPVELPPTPTRQVPPGTQAVVSPPKPVVPPKPVEEKFDTGPSLRTVVREEVQRAIASHVVPVLDVKTIEAAVRSAMTGLVAIAPGSPQVGSVVGAAPVFIPTNIVPTGASSVINVEAETTGSTLVDDASAALKAARGGSRRKQKES